MSSPLDTLTPAELFRAAGLLRRAAQRQRRYISYRPGTPPDVVFLVERKAETFDKVSRVLCALGDERKGGANHGE